MPLWGKEKYFDPATDLSSLRDKRQGIRHPMLWYNVFISGDTLYFNNLVQTKEELENKWIIPVKESWLKNKVSFSKVVS